ncbi:MAG TPA: OmpA family protein [Bacteriovoracaceae bacterium]|nr:OmpA family protein [Bacteriovoracaceae bacterium]
MKQANSKFLTTMSTYTQILILGTALMGCASEVKKKGPSLSAVTPVTLSADAEPAKEIALQESMMNRATMAQIDVLAPGHFNEAKRYMDKANSDNQRGSSGTELLASISSSRAHLNKAEEEAALVQAKVEEVTHARGQALAAGAINFPDKLHALDATLKSYTGINKGDVTPAQKTALQDQYLALELSTIKAVKLNKSKEMLDQARTKGAATVVPKAFQQAVSRYNIAEKLIETDRHNNDKIDASVETAFVASTRVMNLMISEQNSRTQTPEQRAETLEARENALSDSDKALNAANAGSLNKDQALTAQGEALALSQGANQEHERKESDEKIVRDAAAKFDSSEADVYRQDGLLIIRLKSMNFASGRSDLPSESLAVLNKVKEVMKDVGPGKVTVQGHTDSSGAANTNQTLSQTRAQSVAKYFQVDSLFGDSQFDSIGYGYSKPLASNKTKEGRAQNRRVDIVIKTAQQ